MVKKANQRYDEFCDAIDKGDKEEWNRLGKEYQKLDDEAASLLDKAVGKQNEIINKYYSDCINSFVKDLGFEDIEAGKEFLEDWDLTYEIWDFLY